MKDDNPNLERPVPGTPLGGTCQDSWKDRLLDERDVLIQRMRKLKAHMDDERVQHNRKEWEMLEEQYEAMERYLRALNQRCRYYSLIIPRSDLLDMVF